MRCPGGRTDSFLVLNQRIQLSPLDGNERRAKISYAAEQTVQRRLIGYFTDERRFVVSLVDHPDIIEP